MILYRLVFMTEYRLFKAKKHPEANFSAPGHDSLQLLSASHFLLPAKCSTASNIARIPAARLAMRYILSTLPVIFIESLHFVKPFLQEQSITKALPASMNYPRLGIAATVIRWYHIGTRKDQSPCY